MVKWTSNCAAFSCSEVIWQWSRLWIEDQANRYCFVGMLDIKEVNAFLWFLKEASFSYKFNSLLGNFYIMYGIPFTNSLNSLDSLLKSQNICGMERKLLTADTLNNLLIFTEANFIVIHIMSSVFCQSKGCIWITSNFTGGFVKSSDCFTSVSCLKWSLRHRLFQETVPRSKFLEITVGRLSAKIFNIDYCEILWEALSICLFYWVTCFLEAATSLTEWRNSHKRVTLFSQLASEWLREASFWDSVPVVQAINTARERNVCLLFKRLINHINWLHSICAAESKGQMHAASTQPQGGFSWLWNSLTLLGVIQNDPWK